MQKRKIIIDTDPGQDDAVAILLALASPEEIDVLGITAVAGNVPLDLTKNNVRTVCELAQKPEVKVFAGCDTPMKRPLVTAELFMEKPVWMDQSFQIPKCLCKSSMQLIL